MKRLSLQGTISRASRNEYGVRGESRCTIAVEYSGAFARTGEVTVIKGFKNFLMQGQVIVVSVGLVVALAFSTLVKSFTDNIITPLVNAAAGGGSKGKGVGWTLNGQHIDIGAFVSAIVYFVIFMATIYFLIVVPFRAYMRRRGTTVFGDPPAVKTCPQCLSSDLPLAATKCKYCASELSATP